MKKIALAGLFAMILTAQTALAGQPLVTDDTGTQGTGKVQIEITGEYFHDRERVAGATEKARGGNAGATLTVGVHERVDVVAGVPFDWFSNYVNGERIARESGIGDVTFDVKWRFFEKDGWSLALKPGVILPTGDDERGLGNGRVGYRFFLIGTKEVAPWAFHANLGYIRNENSVGDEKNLWHASAAAEYEVIKNLKIVGNVGLESNPDINDNTPPVFALGGIVYQFSESFSVDGGIKVGLTKPETDLTFLIGTTIKF
jgi:hypothetical protein